ncbi:MAG: alkaline phosphatase PhoX, partial [Perlucidibaca sp.]
MMPNRHLLPQDAAARRRFLRNLFLLAGAAAAGPLLTACGGSVGDSAGGTGGGRVAGRFAGIGPLGEPNEFGVRLPEGFSMRIVAQAGQAVGSSGYPWHIFPDGGGVMAREGGGWYYISNSEVPGIGTIGFSYPELAPLTDALEALVPGLGGSSVIAFDADGTIADAYRILSGTTFNCAGCVTPWRTWLSCEEVPSGQVWECDPTGVAAAVARPALGLFCHEATTVDAARKVIYMTEDMPDGRFYRWLPDAADWPAGSPRPALLNGRLQVLQVAGAGVGESGS